MKDVFMKIRNFTEKAIYNDKILLILSVILAIFIWGYITDQKYPDSTEIIRDIAVDYEASLEGTPAGQEGYKIYDADIPNVDIEVTANRKIIGSLDKNSFYAKISTDKYTSEQPVSVNIQIFRSDSNNSDCTFQLVDQKKALVYFYREVSKTINIDTIDAPNITADDGYNLKSITCDSISVTGPEPYINMIKSCTLFLPHNVSYDSRKSFSVDVSLENLTFYDENGDSINEILKPYFDKDDIKINKKDISVMINISMIRNLAITYNLTDVPPDFNKEFITNRLTLSTPSISVSSDDTSIEDMDTLPVDAEQNISLSDITLDFKTSFDIAKALESYPKLTNDTNISTCYVSFDSTGLSEKTFDTLSKSNFSLKNPYSSKYSADFITQALTNITVIGPENEISKINADDLIVEVDLSKSPVNGKGKLNAGRNTYNVSIIPSAKYHNVWVTGEHTVDVEISEIYDVTTNNDSIKNTETY